MRATARQAARKRPSVMVAATWSGLACGVDVGELTREDRRPGTPLAGPRGCARRCRGATWERRPGRRPLPDPPGRGPTNPRPWPGPARRSPPHTHAATSSRSSAVACGVSMPTCTVGPGPATSACACASRSPSDSPRCGCTTQPAIAPRTSHSRADPLRSPASARWHSSKAARHAARVSRSAAAATWAACSMPIACPSRVFTCPATGALATTSALTSPAPWRSRTPSVRCRESDPLTFERVPAARGR